MPGPSTKSNPFVRPANRPAAGGRRPNTYGVSQKSRPQPNNPQHHNRQRGANRAPAMGRHLHHTHQPARRHHQTGPLWNGFINLPRMAGCGGGGNHNDTQKQPHPHNLGEFIRPAAVAAAPLAANRRFQARLNNDLKELWQASPPDRGAYTASTSMPALSDDVLFSGSLFRRPLLRRPVPYPGNQQQPHDYAAATPLPMLLEFTDSTNNNHTAISSLFEPSTSNGARAPFIGVSSNEFGDENSSPDCGGGDLTNDNAFAGFDVTMQQAPVAQQTTLSQLSVCPRESISIRGQPCSTMSSTTGRSNPATAPAPSPFGPAATSSMYAELCNSVRITCDQVRVALYSDGNYIDLAELQRRVRQSSHSMDAVNNEMAAYDETCPFSPMTVMHMENGDHDNGGDTTISTSLMRLVPPPPTMTATTTMSECFGRDRAAASLMLDEEDSGCPTYMESFGRFVDDEVDADDNEDNEGCDSEAGINSPLF